MSTNMRWFFRRAFLTLGGGLVGSLPALALVYFFNGHALLGAFVPTMLIVGGGWWGWRQTDAEERAKEGRP